MIPPRQKTQQQEQQPPGIQCPRCGNLIPASIQQILFANNLLCPTCGLDKNKSKKALKILAKVEEAQLRVENASKFNK